MSNPKGGIADKEGNRYEKWAVISKYIELLENNIDSVTVEQLGQGYADFICKKNDKIYAYQAKARKGNELIWDFSNIKPILKHAKYDLDKGKHLHRIILISPIQEIDYHDMAKGLRGQSLELFYQDQIVYNDSNNKKFRKIQKEFFDSKNEASNIIEALSFLSMFESHTMGDDYNFKNFLIRSLGLVLLGEPSIIFSILYEFIDEHFGMEVTYDILTKFLEQKGFKTRITSKTNDIHLVKEKAQLYLSRYKEKLIDGEVFYRVYTQQILDSLENGNDILITGSAGVGKSGTILDVIQRLQDTCLVFPINVNEEIIGDNTRQMSNSFGFESRLDYVFHDIKSDIDIVIIIDQLDTAKMLNANNGNTYHTIKKFLEDIDFIKAKNDRIRTIITCRTFDLENDKNFKMITERYEQINLEPLAEEEIEQILTKHKINYAKLPRETKKLINTFIMLKIFIDVYLPDNTKKYTTRLDLISAFFEKIDSKHSGAKEVASNIANTLSISKTTIIRKDRLHCDQQILKILKSQGVISEKADNVTFAHQIFYDYFNSIELAEKLEQDVEYALKWLGNLNEQTLNKAVTLSNALLMLTDNTILEIANSLLSSTEIRAHLKYVILYFLSTKEDSGPKLDKYIYSLAITPEFRSAMFGRVFNKTKNFEQLIDSGKAKELLEQNVNRYYIAHSAIRDADKYRTFIEEVLIHHLNNIENANVFRHSLEKMPEWLILQIINHYPEMLSNIHYNSIKSADDVKKITALFVYALGETNFFSNIGYNGTIKEPVNITLIQNKESLMPLLKPLDARVLKECFWRILNKLKAFITPLPNKFDDVLQHKIYSAGSNKTLLNISEFINALGIVISETDDDFIKEIFEVLRIESSPALKPLMYSILSNSKTSHTVNDIIKWLCNEGSLYDKIDKYKHKNPHYYTSMLIEKIVPYASDEVIELLEETILATMPYGYLDWNNIDSRKFIMNNYYYEPQFLLLPAIPEKKLSQRGISELQAAKRKLYARREKYDMQTSSVYSVRSPIQDKAEGFSDKTWMKIFTSQKLNNNVQNREIRENQVILESSNAMFAVTFLDSMKKEPERLTSLLLSSNFAIPIYYVEQAFDALRYMGKRDQVSPNLLKGFIQKFYTKYNSSICRSICSLIEEYVPSKLPVCFYYLLCEIATNAESPEPESLCAGNTNETYETASLITHEDNASNIARGNAYETISNIIKDDYATMQIFIPSMKTGINDHHPSVRISVMTAICSIANIDCKVALELFFKLTKDDYRPALTRDGVAYLNSIVDQRPDVIRDIFYKVIKNGDETDIERVAELATSYYLIYDQLADLVEKCLSNSSETRKGLSYAVAYNLGKYYGNAIPLLTKILSNKRFDTHDQFYDAISFDDFSDKDFKDIFERLAGSVLHIGVFPVLIDRLKDCTKDYISIGDELLKCYALFQKLTEKESEMSIYGYYDASPDIIKNLYDKYQSDQDDEKVGMLLDIWDSMIYENKVYYTDMHEKLMNELN